MMSEKKFKVGLVIGRFQPFHNGHLYLLQEALTIADKIVIGIGSSNVSNSDNPWSFEERKRVVEEVLKKEKLEDKVIRIVDIPDVPEDSEWLRIANSKVGEFDVVIGGNEWVNGIYESTGIPVVRVDFFKRYLHEGRKIRKLMKEKKSWQSRVPPYLVPKLRI